MSFWPLKLTLGIAITLVLFVFLLQFDDRLSPEAQNWLEAEMQNRQRDSEAYTYLLGIQASQAELPVDVGEDLLISIRAAESRRETASSSLDNDQYPEEKKVLLPEGELFCRFSEPKCIVKVLNNTGRVQQETATHKLALNRYKEFSQLKDWKTLIEPSIAEPSLDFRYLDAGHRLYILEALAIAEKGYVDEALKLLHTNTIQLRRWLADADELAVKLLAAELVATNLEWTSIIAQRYQHHELQKMQALTLSERSLKLALQRQFSLAVDLFVKMNKDGKLFASEKGVFINLCQYFNLSMRGLTYEQRVRF